MMKVKKNQRALQIKSNCFGHAALRIRGNKLLSPYHYCYYYYYYYYYYETQSVVVSCSSLFCESGRQPVVKGLIETCTVIHTIMIFLLYIFLASKYQSQSQSPQ